MRKYGIMILVVTLLGACSPASKKSMVSYGQFPEPLPATEGELLYLESKCPLCHGHLGMGEGFLSDGFHPKPTDFTSKEAMAKLSDTEIMQAIRQGKGASMPAYPTFSDQQIRDITRYLRSLPSK